MGGGGGLRSDGEITPCCIAHQPPSCLSPSLWQILCCPALLDDDAPDMLDMLDMLDAESIFEGAAKLSFNAFIDFAPQAVEKPGSAPQAKRMKQASIAGFFQPS